MLRIAVQAKGRLFEETMALLEESDIKLSTTKRTLLVQSSNFPIEVLFLRDDDIPQTILNIPVCHGLKARRLLPLIRLFFVTS